jgi:hypothetical protein
MGITTKIEIDMTTPTSPTSSDYLQGLTPSAPIPGMHNLPPVAPPPPTNTPETEGKPFPTDPMLIFQRVDRDRISISAEVCHRHELDPKRVATLAARHKNGAHFPPLVLFQKGDGDLLLVDGLHRLVAFDQMGVKVLSAVVIDDLGQALVAGIRQNLPKDGRVRSGADATRSLCLLATALGRKITQPEAASLGLRFDEKHEVLSPTALRLMISPLQHSPTGAAVTSKPAGNPPTRRRKKAA